MILAKLSFGQARAREQQKREDLAVDYLAALLHNGQICGEYFYAWRKQTLTAYVHLAGRMALAPKHHTKWSQSRRKDIIRAIGREPRCEFLDDRAHKSGKWQGAPFLYLFTHAFDSAPPVSRGD